MLNTRVRITGIRETVAALESMGVATDDLKDAFSSISTRVVSKAQTIVPVKTGALRADIRPSRTKNKAVVRAGRAGIPYAGVQHWGGRGITASLFLKKPADDDINQHVSDMEKNLTDLARRYGLTA